MHYRMPGVFDLTTSDSREVPVVLDSPHSGRDYPRDFKCLIPMDMLRRVEDGYVDLLFEEAPLAGASLLCALFPRSYIDPNRARSDLDLSLIQGRWPAIARPTEKSRLGHGLIWKVYPPDRPLYKQKLSVEAVRRRIEEYWQPYHETLESEIRRLHVSHGSVWHLNCHSMPSTSSPFVAGQTGARADFVLGDRDGASCEPTYIHMVQDALEEMGYTVVLNNPYRGAELVRAYAAPAQGRHSLQIEINRALYMDEKCCELHHGFATLKADLAKLVARIAAYASQWSDLPHTQAAE